MRQLRIGIWLREKYNPMEGGGFGYYAKLIECISKTKFNNADIVFLTTHKLKTNNIGIYPLVKLGYTDKVLGKLIKIFDEIFQSLIILKLFKNLYYKIETLSYKRIHNICDVIYYPIPGCYYPHYPFIYTLWDLGHVSSYSFPELNSVINFKLRNKHHSTIPSRALMVFCESQVGKEEAIKYLNLNEQKIKVLPLFPSAIVSVEVKPIKPQKIEDNLMFIHYPAQFWPHKNHYNLILAFYEIANQFPELKLIFTGADKGNKPYINRVIEELRISNKIINLGFLSIEELKWVYMHSMGLIMPTLLGPTNMPGLEAIMLGCPVAVSDIKGHHEQFGKDVIYFDPLSISSIVEAIMTLLTNPHEKKNISIPTAETNMILLDKYFDEINSIRFMWD